MDIAREKIVMMGVESPFRETLLAAIESAGYEIADFATAREGLDALRQPGTDVILLNTSLSDSDAPNARDMLAAIRGSAVTERIRVILLLADSGAKERAAGLDLGADDAVSRPLDADELLARVRVQLRARRAEGQLLEKAHLAQEGQQIAHTAFEALAVTEKLTNDAFSLDRRLKAGLGAVFVIAIVMAAIYFLFARSAQKETRLTNAIIARLEGGLVRQQSLIAEARRLRDQQGTAGGVTVPSDALQKQMADLKARMAKANSNDVAALEKQLADTDARLKRVEREGSAAQSLIPADVQSVCLLHVSVAFRNQQGGQRLRYAGLNSQGEPLQDSDGNPILTLVGRGPEVKMDVFGTGFVAGSAGRVMTNRHVAEPWWNNAELSSLTTQGFQAEISSIRAYFPGDPRAFTAEIQEVSKEADLATMRVDMQDLRRSLLPIDSSKGAAVTGEPVVSMGYATGLAGILARTDEDSAQQILTRSGGDVSEVMKELARRNLIRPITTQGHIGDILPNKIVFDAQTTSGGSGGPLFNHQGKVIGVTYAVLQGFGGSNFGIPIRFSQPLLGPQP
jgi:DNA-binding response OmpR family regulator/S1-C subfamily serine protease